VQLFQVGRLVRPTVLAALFSLELKNRSGKEDAGIGEALQHLAHIPARIALLFGQRHALFA